jgi:hypothetical protein
MSVLMSLFFKVIFFIFKIIILKLFKNIKKENKIQSQFF